MSLQTIPWTRLIHSTSSQLIKTILTLSFHVNVALPNDHNSSGFSTDIFYVSMPTCHAQPFLLGLTTITLYNPKHTNYEAPHYVIFSVVLSFPHFRVQIISSAPCPQKPSTYNCSDDGMSHIALCFCTSFSCVPKSIRE
jgi:hypothetical protein